MAKRLVAVGRLREAVAETQAPQLVRGRDTAEQKRRRKRAKAKAKTNTKTKPKTREAVPFRAYLREAGVSRAGNAYEVSLLREGPGNDRDRNWYTPEALRKAISDGLFEGAQCYADHPTSSEERERPERSVRHLVGHFREARYVDGKPAEVRAKFVPIDGEGYEWVRSLIESALGSPDDRPLVGLSIDGYGLDDGEKVHGGKRYALVREIAKLGSVDLVTRAGAGGKFIRRLTESLAEAPAADPRALDAAGMRKRVRKALKRLDEAAGGDPDKLTEAVGLLREVGRAKVSAKRRVKVREVTRTVAEGSDPAQFEALTTRLQESEEQRREAETELATLTRANTARRLLSEAGVSGQLAKVWYDELVACQGGKQAMQKLLERRQAERQCTLAELRESMGLDDVEGAGRRQPAAHRDGDGRGTLLDRMGIDRDELEAA